MQRLNLDEVKKINVAILDYVTAYCDEHGIRYYLAYGTLIGAARHKGFIPWDDDVDIYMPRPDYDRFQREFSGNRKYVYASCETWKRYVYHYAKVYDVDTRIILNNGEVCNDKIGIDIFPLDGLGCAGEKEAAIRLYKKISGIFFRWLLGMSSGQNSTEKTLKGMFFRISYKVGLTNYVARRISKLAATYDYEGSEYVGRIGNYDGKFEYYEKSWLLPARLEFEGKEYCVPAGYDKMLRQYYGDYMQLPPEEKQVSTHEGTYYAIDDND